MGIVSIRISRAAAVIASLTDLKMRKRVRSVSVFCALTMLLFAAASGGLAIAPDADAATMTATGPVNVAVGAQALLPLSGGGFDVTTNYKPYAIPGEAEEKTADPCNDRQSYVPGSPFVLSYANPGQQPVQSSDWWTSIGMQLTGWVSSRGPATAPCRPPGTAVAASQAFYTEPFQFQFVDFNGTDLVSGTNIFGTFPPEAGVALWNENNFQVATNSQVFAKDTDTPLGYNSNLDLVGFGNVGPSHQARVTVGLEGVHPLRVDEFPTTNPTAPPWTNVLVESYSEWGVHGSIHDKTKTNQLDFFANNGSPFVWFQRTKGTAAFNVWVGGVPGQGVQGTYSLVQNSAGVMIVSVTTIYVPNYNTHQPNNNISGTSYYAIWANKGTWTQKATSNQNSVAEYQNTSATAVIVTALPHNFTTNTAAVTAWNFMQPFACRLTTDTELILPTPSKTVTVNGTPVTLGYSSANAMVTGELSIDNGIMPGFETSCTAGDSLQMIFPHHRKVLVPSQKSQIVTSTPGPLIWNSLMGPAMAYVGNTMFLQNQTRGIMSVLPSVAIDNPAMTNPTNPSQTGAEDIYNTLKAWYFVEEPTRPSCTPSPTGCIPPTGSSHLNSFARNPSTYMTTGDNTYITGTTTLRELLVVADQLAQTSNPKIKGVMDPQLDETKDQAAAEIRAFILRTLEEMIGQWGDVYTANLLMYNPDYSTMYGYPDGYGDVGHLADHHYHYGYFLRAAAAIGRYDPDWLKAHMTIFTNLLSDVACFNCNGGNQFTYPPLRNFNPYYGHSWADGAAYGGNNQESTSEAINFEVGLIELGEATKNDQWRDLGLYLYEQEINSVEQYWFNQDADLTDNLSTSTCPTKAPYTSVSSVPPLCYNGNWARQFVTYKRATDSSVQHHTLADQLFNQFMTRTTFFDASPFAAYTIEMVPAGPSGLYLSRDQDWLEATWTQFMSDNDFYQTQSKIMPILESVYGNVAATVQGQLPPSGSGIEGTGLEPALARINPVHAYYTPAMNTEAKYMAYTIAALGPLNGNYAVTSPTAGVFTSGGTTSFVAFNPTGSPISVSFKGGTSAGPFTIPANTEQTYRGGSLVSSFTPGDALDVPPSRLYLHGNLTLNSTPGTLILPSNGSYPFPADSSLIKSTFVTIPPRGDGVNAQFPAPNDLSKIITFVGSFNGKILDPDSCSKIYPNGPLVCDPTTGLQSVDRFAIYTDQCLPPPPGTGGPGWQRCNTIAAGNTYNMVASYYFDTTKCKPNASGVGIVPGSNPTVNCNADRIEYYTMQAGPSVSSWSGTQDESNEYYFSGVDLGVPESSKPNVPNITSGFNGSFGLNLQDLNGNSAGVAPASCGGNPDDGSPFPPFYDPLHNNPPKAFKAPGPCFQGTPMFPTKVNARGLFVPTVNNGGLVLQFWGGAVTLTSKNAPIPLSVDVDPMLNRASWFQPPYLPAVGPTPTPTVAPTSTAKPTASPAKPTPTPTGIVIVTPTPVRTPTRTPTAIPTRTPTMTPTRTPVRTGTPIRTPTPTPTAAAPISVVCADSAQAPTGGSNMLTIGLCDQTSGDLYVASISSSATQSISAPAGWTRINQTDATGVRLTTFWHRASTSEPDSYTWQCGGSCFASGGIAAYSGVVVSGSPIDATSVNPNTSKGTPETALSVNTTAANDYVIATCGDIGSTSGTWSAGKVEWLLPFLGGSRWFNSYTDKPGPSAPGPTGAITFKGAAADYWACQQITLLSAASMELSTAKGPAVISPVSSQPRSSMGLWVPNLGSDSISEFTGTSLSASGAPAANLTIQSSGGYFSALKTPDAVTFDNSNNLWSSNCHGGPDSRGSVTEFALAQLQVLHTNGNPSPNTVVYNNPATGSLDCPTGLTFDQSGNLWVASNGSANGGSAHLAAFGSAQLSGYTNVQPQAVISGGGLSDPLGMTFDKAHNLWVADLRAGDNGALFQYSAEQLSANGTQTPNLTVSSASLRQPETVLVDKSGNLWTVNCGNATLQMFAAADLVGSGTIEPVPQVTISAGVSSTSANGQGLDCREGLALDSSGGLWVANYYSDNFGSLVRFTPEQLLTSGNPVPEVLINSTSTGSNISRPFLIGFGPAIK
jgi:hypothetical protein